MQKEHSARIHLKIRDGIVLIGSDGHYWPGRASTAHRAFVHFARRLGPSAIIFNGDALDGASISRHPPIGWETRPSVAEEIAVCQERLQEIQDASPCSSRIWTRGNHCVRYETRLASAIPEFSGVKGLRLADQFPSWEFCWSVWLNGSVVVKHRNKGGTHAAHNNAVVSGMTMVTGHTHQLKVAGVPDYRGTRWGVECGCLADIYAKAFENYTEDNPRLWQSGFALLTFVDGRLLQPELVRVHDKNHVDFRGELIKI